MGPQEGKQPRTDDYVKIYNPFNKTDNYHVYCPITNFGVNIYIHIYCLFINEHLFITVIVLIR